MRDCILWLLFAITLSPSFKYWEDYSQLEQKQIMKSLDETNIVSEYLAHPWLPIDDEKTFCLLDVLSTSGNFNWGYKALYFHVFNDICIHADGALAEVMGVYCYKVFWANPDYVFHYVLLHESLKDCYVSFLGHYFSMEHKAYGSFCGMLNSKLNEKENAKQLNVFLDSIRDAIVRCEE